ncbi:class I SAM-dependent methyltransferase [Paenibacillus pini]|uniref:UbiE/COQ5 methyltransferase n=1 Tax=Paenibacillus pini JCM 16418 TaxID=1236976 RepID=W7YJ45_9BACL|nr:class I SAM-dependent methyltransferase [Paenibacillus pini]GAF07598.1 UbiE/COQ5 methyltransferase [Paenibacillus pini JCM 16418]
MGEGAAHPGGFAATLQLLKRHPIVAGQRVLEVGCGTGRTACHLARSGCIVTAIDNHQGMLAKARTRAKRQHASITFIEGDVTKLPFDDHSFDVVFVESVTLFADPIAALTEYRRVLIPGGRLVDRELCARKQDVELEKTMKHLYGIRILPNPTDWQDLLTASGFNQIQIETDSKMVNPLDRTTAAIVDRDQMVDFAQIQHPEVLAFLKNNEKFIKEQYNDFTYIIMMAINPS